MSSARSLTSELLRFWRDVEFFNPFDLDDIIESSGLVTRVPFDMALAEINAVQQSFSWGARSQSDERDPEWEYAHDFFFAPFFKTQIRDCLGCHFPQLLLERMPDHRELTGLTCLGRITFNDKALPVLPELKLSTLPWAIDRLMLAQNLNLSSFDSFTVNFLSQLRGLVTQQKAPGSEESALPRENRHLIGGIVPHNVLRQISALAVQDSRIEYFPQNLLGVLVSYPIRKKPKKKLNSDGLEEESVVETNSFSDDDLAAILSKVRRIDILNSFCLTDLERAHLAHVTPGSAPVLDEYLNALLPKSKKRTQRINVLEEANKKLVLDWCRPEKHPKAKWPANPEQNLSLTQQLAINYYFSSGVPLVAVNGPPGTGKTTIIRDIAANIIVERAIKLAVFKSPKKTLSANYELAQYGKRSVRYRPLDVSLRGFEIVVTSNNNAAVENISRALPLKECLGSIFGQVRYLEPLAQHYFNYMNRQKKDKPSHETADEKIWGLPSIALGNRKNRMNCRNSIFFEAAKEAPDANKPALEVAQQNPFLDIFSWRKTAPQGAKSYTEARRAFLFALKKSQEHGTTQSSFFNADQPQDSAWLSKESQLNAPGLSSLGNLLKGQLFLAALEFHEAWIREVPSFEYELRALSALLAAPQAFSASAARRLWELFFMVFPIVSTTLASVERMFAPLSAASLGHVIIDEAGQATPQAVAGILMRAKRAIVIGDQRQLEPICQVPETVIQHLSSQVGEALSPFCRSLATLSAQTLADSASLLGTYFDSDLSLLNSEANESKHNTWVGIPLIVHRRCQEPMFSIANRIAYNDIMINATPQETEAMYETQPSCWIQVEGAARDRQWVAEQGQVCLSVVQRLLAQNDEIANFFIISPFRAVRRNIKALIDTKLKSSGFQYPLRSQVRRSIGTIHTFQGRESDVVILLLGCDFQHAGGADWAGEKPNLLNVAVTRARQKLYVIGDVNIWHNRGFFSDLEKRLPRVSVEEFFAGGLARVENLQR